MPMTPDDQKRRDAILAMIEEYTKENTVSRKVARDTLIAEGIYTKRGKLRAEFRYDSPIKKASTA
ncbi:MAG: hypothetical protein JNM13_02450 [Hyphomicrobiaceae bacterium]|nr:hypothetical protein [Hyphomicrobiaceae bacterium]